MKKIEQQLVPQFRSFYNVGTFNDDEKGGGEILVDQSAYETAQQIVEKVLRGERVESRFIPQYDVDSKTSDEEAFSNADITQQDGFDLADVARIRSEEAQVKKGIATAKAEKLKAKQEAEKKELVELRKAKKEEPKGLEEPAK